MTKNLLIITQKVDAEDDLLGFFVDWIREFAKHFNRVFVITLAKGDYQLPKNVFIYSLGKERGTRKTVRLIAFYKLLFTLVPKSSGIFAHMSPIFAVASWPIAALFGKRIVLWYLHRSVTLRLKLAEKICYKIATSARESLNIKSKKIIELGHGIDIEKFRKTQRNWDDVVLSKSFNILSVGRISRIKDYETLIKAAGILKDKGLDFRLKIAGRPVMSYDFEYFQKLKKLVGDLGLENFIEFTKFVPYSQISDFYKKSDIFINLAPKGGIDKAVLEAMAAGCLTLVSNEVFGKYLGDLKRFLVFKHNDPNNLAEKILGLLKLPEQKIKDISGFLEESVRISHSISNTINKISQLFD